MYYLFIMDKKRWINIHKYNSERFKNEPDPNIKNVWLDKCPICGADAEVVQRISCDKDRPQSQYYYHLYIPRCTTVAEYINGEWTKSCAGRFTKAYKTLQEAVDNWNKRSIFDD